MRLAPWHVKGIGPQARESAREAARRSGMSVGQWLNSVILDQAAQEAIHGAIHEAADDDAYDDVGADEPHGDDLASITERLDDLGRQIERLAGNPRAAERDAGVSRRIADAIQNLSGRLDRLIAEGRTASSALEQRVNSVDQALAKLGRERMRAAASFAGGDPVSVGVEQATAEIAARQRALDAELAAPVPDIVRQYAPPQCRADAAVDSLRKDLTEIGRVISDAMPREAVEALEGEVRALGTRLDTAQRSPANAPAVAGLERGLHEVRDALRGLAPAESLTGFDAAIRALSNKIDMIAGARQDPAGLQQIEAAIGALRGLVGQVASSDALAALSQEVRSLSDRVERGAPASGGADVLASLDRRIA
ncbi:MAG TPA: hypothetical protein VLX44_06540, partial [Xanthobacteraceae bacterium]|nr:hypothetical protein [Xanthobacteraceae bacterium]